MRPSSTTATSFATIRRRGDRHEVLMWQTLGPAIQRRRCSFRRQGQQNGGVGGHDELRLAVAGGPADDVSQFHLPPRRKSGFLPLPTQAFVAVVAFAHARTAIFDLDRRYRAGLLQWKLDFERL